MYDNVHIFYKKYFFFLKKKRMSTSLPVKLGTFIGVNKTSSVSQNSVSQKFFIETYFNSYIRFSYDSVLLFTHMRRLVCTQENLKVTVE